MGHDLYWDIVSVRVLSIGTPSIGHLGHFMSIGTSMGTLGALARAKEGFTLNLSATVEPMGFTVTMLDVAEG